MEIVVAVPSEVADAHRRPGQFAKLRVSDAGGRSHEGIFAMANAPNERCGEFAAFRFLLRTNNPEGGEAAQRLATMPIGAPLEISEPAGPGFDLTRAHGRCLCFVATGTAIAPVRAGVESLLASDIAPKAISLDHGLRSRAHLAFGSDLERYARAGISVHVHFSEPGPDGVVRGTLAHRALLGRLEAEQRMRDALVIAVGQSAMIAELRAEFVARGGLADDVVSNH